MTLFLRVLESKGNETIIFNGLYTKEELRRELFSRVEQKSMTSKEAYEVLAKGIKAPADGSLRIRFCSKGTIVKEGAKGVTEYAETVRKGTVIDVYSNCTYKESTKLDYFAATVVAKMYA